MTTETITLSSFLLARIAEDEACALAVEKISVSYRARWHNDVRITPGSPEEPFKPARVLAECAAKRAIVEEHADDHGCVRYVDADDNRDCFTLRALAAVYSSHPDYREAWKP